MTKITTDFVGTETAAVTKQRLTDILDFWEYDPSAYTTWGDARTDLNGLLADDPFTNIAATELAGTFLPKINYLNHTASFAVWNADTDTYKQGGFVEAASIVTWNADTDTYTQELSA
jgi:hypothetical protein